MAYSQNPGQAGSASPGWDAFTVTPSDSTSYTQGVARALWVGGSGNVTLITAGGSTAIFYSVPAGTMLSIAHTRVNSTATTATYMTAVF